MQLRKFTFQTKEDPDQTRSPIHLLSVGVHISSHSLHLWFVQVKIMHFLWKVKVKLQLKPQGTQQDKWAQSSQVFW